MLYSGYWPFVDLLCISLYILTTLVLTTSLVRNKEIQGHVRSAMGY